MEKPRISTLSNGLTVITQRFPSKQTYANITVNVGFRHESPEETGITHYLEHLVALDNQRMNKVEKDKAINNMRGFWNANTSLERTSYFLQLGAEYINEGIEILSDGILRTAFDEYTINKERDAIKQEFAAMASNPARIIYDQMLQVAFPGTNIDNSLVKSTEQIIDGQGKDELKAFMDKHYTGDNMVLAVVGDVDHEEICKMAEKHFAGLKPTPDTPREPAPYAKYRGGMRVRDSQEAEQSLLRIVFEGAGRDDAKNAAIDDIIGDILGDGFSSRLMQSLRSDKGLVYSTSAGSSNFKDNGLFTVSAGTTSDNLPAVVDAIVEELNRFADTVTQEEMNTIKNSLLGSAERGVESPSVIGGALAVSKAVDNKIYDMQAYFDSLQNVTLEEVKARARELFSSTPGIVVYGKDATKHMPSYEEITRKLGKERHLDESGLALDNAPSADRPVGDAAITAAPQAQKQHRVA